MVGSGRYTGASLVAAKTGFKPTFMVSEQTRPQTRFQTHPQTRFQTSFRVQSPWSIKNPNGDDPKQEEILKPVCYVFDFAPTRALRQLSEYGIVLSPNEANPEKAVEELVSFLPVLGKTGEGYVH